MLKIGLDWLQFSYTGEKIDWKSLIPGLEMRKSGGAFYQIAYAMRGLTISTCPKKGCLNLDTEIKFTGEAFELYPGLPESVFSTVLSTSPKQISLARMDYRLDFISGPFIEMMPAFNPEDFQPTINKKGVTANTTYYYDETGLWTGLLSGKSDVVLRVYDKMAEKRKKEEPVNEFYEEWWRIEIQMRGDKLRAQGFEEKEWNEMLCSIHDTAIAMFKSRIEIKNERLKRYFEDKEEREKAIRARETTLEGKIKWRVDRAKKMMREARMMVDWKKTRDAIF